MPEKFGDTTNSPHSSQEPVKSDASLLASAAADQAARLLNPRSDAPGRISFGDSSKLQLGIDPSSGKVSVSVDPLIPLGNGVQLLSHVQIVGDTEETAAGIQGQLGPGELKGGVEMVAGNFNRERVTYQTMIGPGALKIGEFKAKDGARIFDAGIGGETDVLGGVGVYIGANVDSGLSPVGYDARLVFGHGLLGLGATLDSENNPSVAVNFNHGSVNFGVTGSKEKATANLRCSAGPADISVGAEFNPESDDLNSPRTVASLGINISGNPL